MRCCRPAAQALKARRVPPCKHTVVSAIRFTDVTFAAARAYSTSGAGGGPSSSASSNRALYSSLAVGGFVAGFVVSMGSGFFNRPSAAARCDGVPNVDFIETNGRTWEPVHALEKDDPKVRSETEEDDGGSCGVTPHNSTSSDGGISLFGGVLMLRVSRL